MTSEPNDFEAPTSPGTLTGHPVLDDQNRRVGTVSDVIYDNGGLPRWAVVDPGVLRAEKYVPIEGSFMTTDGDVVVPYSKDQIKSASKANRDHVMEPDTERALVRHYELT